MSSRCVCECVPWDCNSIEIHLPKQILGKSLSTNAKFSCTGTVRGVLAFIGGRALYLVQAAR